MMSTIFDYLVLGVIGACLVLFFIVLIFKQIEQDKDVLCIDNVEYIKIEEMLGDHFVPHFKTDGALYTCE